AAVMSSSGEELENPKETHGLFKKYIKCSHGALCQPATEPPVITPELHPDVGNYEPIVQNPSGHREKRGSKPVPIIFCNRKTGKCQRM
ncbi:hypothetical protein L9G74_20345, partial [Shewanella sp. C32]